VTPPPLAQADPARLAIFLDFDGCLVDLAPRPHDVVVPLMLAPILHRLWRRTGGALALVSGRPVTELRAFLPGLAILLCGSHGAERAVQGRRVTRLPVDQCALAQAATRAQADLMAQPGLLLERKPVGLGLHYRGAPDRAGAVTALAEALLPGLPGFHAHHGKMVIELRPDGIGKGHALRDLMRSARFRADTPSCSAMTPPMSLLLPWQTPWAGFRSKSGRGRPWRATGSPTHTTCAAFWRDGPVRRDFSE
jgi:trehalose 6-phosphate phosphatase